MTLLNELLKIVNKTKAENVNLYLISKPKNKEDFEVFNTITMNNKINKDMLDIIQKQLSNNLEKENFEIIEYNPLFEDKSIVQKISCNELTLLPKFIEEINLDCETYEQEKLKKGHQLWIAVIVIDNGSKKIYAFQKLRSKLLMENKKYFVSFGSKKINRFEKPLLQLERYMDCICLLENETLENDMYIFNKTFFEMIFGFEKKVKKENIEKISKLQNDVDFDENLLDLPALYHKIENNQRHIKKLYVILNNDTFKYLNEENIQKIEEKCNIIFNRESGKLRIQDNEDVKKILNFLNDDFLEGIISQKAFLTSNKIDL